MAGRKESSRGESAGDGKSGSGGGREQSGEDFSQKSEWMSSTDSAASDPLTEEEKRGIDLLGHSGERNDAIAGVSDDPDATSESGGEREG